MARRAEHGLLGPGFVGAHGVWLAEDDMRMLADAGAAIAHNPGSNLRLGCGIAPVRELLDRGVAVGLGTDGSVCADNQNLFEALRIASVVSTIRFPHETGRWLDETRFTIEAIDWLSAADKKMIFEDNAKKVFNLKD